MIEVEEKLAIAAPADAVWALVGDYAGLGAWLTGVGELETDGIGPGAVRLAKKPDGVVVERLVARDEAAMRLSYAITDGPVAFTGYLGVMQVTPTADGGCQVSWGCRCQPKPGVNAERLSARMHSFYAEGLQSLAGAVARGG